MNAAGEWKQARDILCVRLDNLGDVLMTTPAMHALRQSWPQRRLTLLASPSGAALQPYLDDVDDVIAYGAPWVKNDGASRAADQAVIETLAARRFDAAVIFTVYSQSPLPAALMCRLAGIPRVLAHCRENPYHLINGWLRETEPAKGIRHEVQRQLDLVASMGAACEDKRLRFATREEDRASLHRKLAGAGLDVAAGWMAAHCGASAPSRRYPPEMFSAALSLIGKQAGAIVLTGGAGERELVGAVAAACADAAPVLDMSGKLTLGELACVIEDACLLLSNNTGPVHLAAALGTPVVDLYALTNPQHTPWQLPHRLLYHDVPCKYCYSSVCPEGHHACLRGVPPEAVRDAVLDLLAECGPRSGLAAAGAA